MLIMWLENWDKSFLSVINGRYYLLFWSVNSARDPTHPPFSVEPSLTKCEGWRWDWSAFVFGKNILFPEKLYSMKLVLKIT